MKISQQEVKSLTLRFRDIAHGQMHAQMKDVQAVFEENGVESFVTHDVFDHSLQIQFRDFLKPENAEQIWEQARNKLDDQKVAHGMFEIVQHGLLTI